MSFSLQEKDLSEVLSNAGMEVTFCRRNHIWLSHTGKEAEEQWAIFALRSLLGLKSNSFLYGCHGGEDTTSSSPDTFSRVGGHEEGILSAQETVLSANLACICFYLPAYVAHAQKSGKLQSGYIWALLLGITDAHFETCWCSSILGLSSAGDSPGHISYTVLYDTGLGNRASVYRALFLCDLGSQGTTRHC